jgi:acylphosphatase
MVRAHVYISGLVQGVGFRDATWRMARRNGLRGWVRNRRDGRVEAVFEGDPAAVNAAVEWCRHGPPAAVVEDVEVVWEQPGSEPPFEIRWTA